MVVFGKQLNISSTTQKEIGFSLKPHDKLQQPLQQPQQQQQQNDHLPTEEVQSASSESMTEIVMNYQPHQPPKTFKFPKNVVSNTFGLKSTHCWTVMLKKIQRLVLFASDRTQTCFQRNVRKKPFPKQVTKTGKKPQRSLTSTSILNVTSLPLHMK